MKIPILNIYYLLCYAWDNIVEGSKTHVDTKDTTNLLDLFGKVLVNGTSYLFKRGLNRQYLVVEEAISGLKGKMNVSETIKGNCLQNAKVYCEYDELSYNVLHNQILKTTVYKLLNTPSLNKDLKRSLKEIFNRLYTVDLIRITPSTFSRVRLNRNNRYYLFLLNVCKIIHENLLPDERTGELVFSDFIRDESKMRRIFERFIYNFYRIEQAKYPKVKRENIHWQFDYFLEEDKAFLPQMQTDITLENRTEKIIIDAKYYSKTMATHYEKEIVQSANLYQLFSYLLNQEDGSQKTEHATGILIYPTIEKTYNLNYRYKNHPIKIATINLNQDWKQIHEDLLGILGI